MKKTFLVLSVFLCSAAFAHAQQVKHTSGNTADLQAKQATVSTLVIEYETPKRDTAVVVAEPEDSSKFAPQESQTDFRSGLESALPGAPLESVPSSNEEPVIEEPVAEPEPVVVEPEPVIEEPVAEPEPEPIVEPEPVIEEPVAEPEPEPIVEPEPVIEEPVAEPEPEPIVEPEPVVVEPEPEPVIEEPVLEPEPIVEPEPVATPAASVVPVATRTPATAVEAVNYSAHAYLMDDVDSIPYYSVTRVEGDSVLTDVMVRSNPTADNLIVQLGRSAKGYHYTLTRYANHQIIDHGTWQGLSVRLSMKDYAVGDYMLSIMDNADQQLCVYKISKVLTPIKKRKN